MTVEQLIEQLKSIPPDLQVVMWDASDYWLCDIVIFSGTTFTFDNGKESEPLCVIVKSSPIVT